jgi:PAS domain S-box-containing protein
MSWMFGLWGKLTTDKMDLDKNGNSESNLRDLAEEKIAESQTARWEFKDKTPEEIIHELQVHQIELEMQNDELKRVQIALEKSRDKFQDLYDSVPVGHFTLTHTGLIKEVNRTGAILLGMPRSKLINMRFGHFVAHESEDQWYRHIISTLGREEKQSCVLTLKGEDGSSFNAFLESIHEDAPVELKETNGATLVVNMTVTDITERKRAEERLRDEKDKLKSVLDHMIDGVYILNPNYEIEYLNPALKSERGDIAERRCFEYLTCLTEPCPWCKNRQVFAGESLIWERTSITTGKTYDIFETPIKNSDGSVSKLSILHDVTERKRMDEELLKSERRYRSLYEGIRDGIVLVDMEGRIKEFNSAYIEMLGYTPEELLTKTYKDITPTN